MVDLLLETPLTSEQKEYLEDARVCAESLLAVLNATLEYSALSADLVSIEEADFSLLSILNDALTDFGYKARAKGLRLTANFAPDVPEVAFGDGLRLQQIFSHVLGNAIKFASQGGVDVEVRATWLDESGLLLKLNICDTGIGISEANLNHIFDSFRQLETGLARRYTGMGLGLAVTRKLVTLLNGEVAVTSRLGQGTQFGITIPLKTAREQAHPLRVLRVVPDLNPIRILVVEDDRVAQTVTVHFLRRLPFQVDTAASGSAALDSAKKNQYSLILMDLQMPDMDGFETAVRIRNLPGYAGVPVVALTANYSPEYRDMCSQYGFQGFLTKPVVASEFLKTVETLLAPSNGLAGHNKTSPAGITRIAV